MDLQFYRRLSKNRVNLKQRDIAVLCGGCLLFVVVLLLASTLVKPFIVDGVSMTPALENGQYVLASRTGFFYDIPKRGDLVIIDSSEGDIIKRVIGLPGELLEFRASQVYIDGQRLEEPYIVETCHPELCSDRIWQIGTGQYFVMGDNRNASRDSRYSGTIAQEAIAGHAIFRYYPFSTAKWLN